MSENRRGRYSNRSNQGSEVSMILAVWWSNISERDKRTKLVYLLEQQNQLYSTTT